MNITWHGYHTIKIVTHGLTLVLDPHAPQKDLPPFRAKTDIVALSNPSDENMSHLGGIQGAPIVINTPGEYSLSGLTLCARGWHHADGSERSLQRWRIEDVTILHLGDLSRKLTTEELQEIEQIPIDILLLPINGHDKTIITVIEPRIVIPINYTSIDNFAKEMGVSPSIAQSKLTVNARKLPAEGLATVILSP
ncbi:MAG: MBL fold metallo-hydrolase [bacterium]